MSYDYDEGVVQLSYKNCVLLHTLFNYLNSQSIADLRHNLVNLEFVNLTDRNYCSVTIIVHI